MNDVFLFIQNFISRKGGYIFIATVFSRLLSFLASWIALQLIPTTELGYAIYAFYIMTFIIPLAGFGFDQGVLRYGSQLKTIEEKNSLFLVALKKGVLFTLILIIFVLISSGFITENLQKSRSYFIIFSFSILTFYLFQLLKVQFRILEKNKLYAYLEVAYNIIFVLLIYFLSIKYHAKGYAFAFVITPLIAFILFVRYLKIDFKKVIGLDFINFAFYKYGFFSSLATISAQLLLAIDILLIGNILKDPALVTAYKYVMLVPFSLQILTRTVLTTDFVTLTKNIQQKMFIKKYIKSYLQLLTSVSLLILVFFFFFGKNILHIFKTDYQQYHLAFMLLTGAIIAVILLRGLFDNLLSAMGKATIIYYISTVGLVLNYSLNKLLIPKYSITGAAFTTLTVMWFTGIISALVFYYYFQKEKGFSNKK